MRSDFVKPLLIWYNNNARDLPWRRTKDPYLIWVSEIMLQQTRVEAVLGYYERFTTRLPGVADLAGCPEDELLKLWEGLGYYSRVRNMQKAAQVVCDEYGGQMPQSVAALLTLPGIGEYTAGAISSIAFGMAEPAVDGNVLRVAARLDASAENILSEHVKKRVRAELRELYSVNDGTWGDLNQAFMDLGAGICLANGEPKCQICPLRAFCKACLDGVQNELPVREKKLKRKKESRTVLLLRSDETYAIRKRPDSGLLAGLYEFPNVPGELTQEEVTERVREWGYSPLRVKKLTDAKHIFSHVEWHMTGYEILIAPAEFGQDELRGECIAEKKPAKRNIEESATEFLFAEPGQIERMYPIPSAFEKYAKEINIRTGKKREEK